MLGLNLLRDLPFKYIVKFIYKYLQKLCWKNDRLKIIFKLVVHFIDVSKACELEQSKFSPVGAPLPGVHVLIMDNEYNIKNKGVSGEVNPYILYIYIHLFYLYHYNCYWPNQTDIDLCRRTNTCNWIFKSSRIKLLKIH